MPHKDPEARRRYQHEYYLKNIDRYKVNSKAWHEANREKIRAHRASRKDHNTQMSREWREDNRDKLMLIAARRRAAEAGLEFNIDVSDIQIPDTCPVFGFKLSHSGKRGCTDASPSLDRLDSGRGYVKGNVWVISHKANTMKSRGTPAELRMLADAIEKKMAQISGADSDSYLAHKY